MESIHDRLDIDARESPLDAVEMLGRRLLGQFLTSGDNFCTHCIFSSH